MNPLFSEKIGADWKIVELWLRVSLCGIVGRPPNFYPDYLSHSKGMACREKPQDPIFTQQVASRYLYMR